MKKKSKARHNKTPLEGTDPILELRNGWSMRRLEFDREMRYWLYLNGQKQFPVAPQLAQSLIDDAGSVAVHDAVIADAIRDLQARARTEEQEDPALTTIACVHCGHKSVGETVQACAKCGKDRRRKAEFVCLYQLDGSLKARFSLGGAETMSGYLSDGKLVSGIGPHLLTHLPNGWTFDPKPLRLDEECVLQWFETAGRMLDFRGPEAVSNARLIAAKLGVAVQQLPRPVTGAELEELRSAFNEIRHYVAEIFSGHAPAPHKEVRLKKSTERGEGRAKLIAALTKHHRYVDDIGLNYEPIKNNDLARLASVSRSTSSAFFKKQFGGYAKYRLLCRNDFRLRIALRLLNQEFAPVILYQNDPSPYVRRICDARNNED